MRQLSLPKPDDDGRSDNPFHGYIVKPKLRFPTEQARWVQWIYVVDLDSDTLSVGIPFYMRRVFKLQNIPRSLFDPQPSPSGEISQLEPYRVLLDAVPRAHLAGISVPVEPDAALIELYWSYSPQIEPLPTPPGLAGLPVRKYLRLCLARIFADGHMMLLETIHSRQVIPGSTPVSSGQWADTVDHRFRQMVYGIVNIMSSCVEVQFKTGRRYLSTADWRRNWQGDQQSPTIWPFPPAEYWIGDILIVPALEMTTTENLHAALGKAIQLVHTRINEQGPTSNNDPPQTIRAVIVSLCTVVMADICGAKLTHTPNMPLLTRDKHVTSGLCALLEILYTPAPRPLATSVPPLPVELWQKVYSLADDKIKLNLAVTSRLFRGIAYDYGPRIGEWSLQRPCPLEAGLAFSAAADRGVHVIGRKVRQVPARSEVVYVSTSRSDFRPILRVVLRRSTGEALELQMPLVGVQVARRWDLGVGKSKWSEV